MSSRKSARRIFQEFGWECIPAIPLPSGKDYLLSRFTRQQNETLDAFVDLAADATESIIAEGVEMSMARFNRRAQGAHQQRGRMRIYENLFIVKPDATEEEIDHLVEQMSKNVTTAGGTVDKVDKWGKRRLAYRVEKHREGSYVLLQFTAEPATVKEFERRLRVQDSGDQVPDGAHRRDVEAPRQTEERTREARAPASAGRGSAAFAGPADAGRRGGRRAHPSARRSRSCAPRTRRAGDSGTRVACRGTSCG